MLQVTALLLAILAGVLASLATSVPGADTRLFLLAVGVFLVASVSALAAAYVWQRGRKAGRRSVGVLVLAAVVLAGTVAAVHADLPLLVRFELSRSSLEAIVAQPSVSDGQVGLFVIRDYTRTDYGARFTISEGGLIEEWGLAYSPAGPPGPPIVDPVPVGTREYRHLDGPWYVWELPFT